ncbi:MAG: hypothetical protein KKG00_07430 [Bacteroidetes bacterium]|nr:hypothetical protein [Bacteroidota bacterium]
MQRLKYLVALLVFTIFWQPCLSQNVKLLAPDQGKLDYALDMERKALRNKDSVRLGEAYYIMGKIYTASGDLPKAQDYFLKALRILEPRGPSFEVSRLYLRLSALSASKEASKKLVEKAYTVCMGAGDQRGAYIARTSLDRFRVAEEVDSTGGPLSLKTYREVLRNFKEVKNFHIRQKDTLGIADMNELIGALMMDQGESGCDTYFELADAGYESLKKPVQQTSCQINLARSKLRQGDIEKAGYHLQLAEKYYAMGDARVLNTDENFAETYIDYYEALGNWQKVAEWQSRYMGIRQIMEETDRQNAYARLNLEYQTELKEAKLMAQANELVFKDNTLRDRSNYLIALSLLLIVALVSGSSYYRLSRKYKRISAQNAQLVHEQNHRVKNNLQLVSSLLYLQASHLKNEEVRSALEESQLRIDVMAALQRKLYENEQIVSIPMRSFLTEIVDMTLSAFGYQHIDTDFDIADGSFLKTDKAISVGLIINELVTNACKYAFPTVALPRLRVCLEKVADLWTLRVADNGAKQWDPDRKQELPLSFGHRLILIQVKQLMGDYNLRTSDGTTFEMTFTTSD